VPSSATIAATAAATTSAAIASGATQADAVKQGKQAAAAAKADQESASTPPSPLSQLVKYIPTETIALYISVQGALGDVALPQSGKISDADFSSRWAWLWAMLAATVALTIGLSYRSQKNSNSYNTFQFPFFESMAAGLAFVLWAFALPGTPLRDYEGYDYSAWNGVLILGGTIIISTTAFILGKSVSWTKVVDV
jgi:hypothetical protein